MEANISLVFPFLDARKEGRNAQCVYTRSHAYMMKIPMTYYKAPTTNFRLFLEFFKY